MVARELGKTYFKVQNTLAKYKFHPYKILPVQYLTEENKRTRLNFARRMMGHLEQDRNLFNKIVWTDESTFSTSASFNRRNTHIWSQENPRGIRQIKRSGRSSVNVWSGILNNRVIGPIFFDGSLNGVRYFELVQDVVQNLPAGNEVLWQQDGAPCHNVRPVTRFLNESFPIWFGRFGTVRWPPNSPDLTVMDTFLWGYLKDKLTDAVKDELVTPQRIRNFLIHEIESLNTNNQGFILAAIERQKRIYVKCIELNGGHVEHLAL